MNESLPGAMVAPMSFGQILERTFRLLRSRFWLLAKIGAVPAGAIAFAYLLMLGVMSMTGLFSHAHPAPAAINAVVLPVMLILWIPLIVVLSLYEAAAVFAAGRADLGAEVCFRTAWAEAWSHAGRFIWLHVLRTLYAVWPAFGCGVLVGIFIALAKLAGGFGGGSLALFLLIPLGVLLYCGTVAYAVGMGLRLSLAFPAAIEEGLTARAALRRSGQLTKGAKGRIFLALLVICAGAYVLLLALIAIFVVLIVGAAIFGSLGHFHGISLLGGVGAGLFAVCLLGSIFLWIALTYAACTSCLAIFYHDQRGCEQQGMLAPPEAGAPA